MLGICPGKPWSAVARIITLIYSVLFARTIAGKLEKKTLSISLSSRLTGKTRRSHAQWAKPVPVGDPEKGREANQLSKSSSARRTALPVKSDSAVRGAKQPLDVSHCILRINNWLSSCATALANRHFQRAICNSLWHRRNNRSGHR